MAEFKNKGGPMARTLFEVYRDRFILSVHASDTWPPLWYQKDEVRGREVRRYIYAGFGPVKSEKYPTLYYLVIGPLLLNFAWMGGYDQ